MLNIEIINEIDKMLNAKDFLCIVDRGGHKTLLYKKEQDIYEYIVYLLGVYKSIKESEICYLNEELEYANEQINTED